MGETTGMDELLTAEELASILKMDKTTIYRLIRKQGIPAFKVGQEWRVARSDLEAWIASQKMRALASVRTPIDEGAKG